MIAEPLAPLYPSAQQVSYIGLNHPRVTGPPLPRPVETKDPRASSEGELNLPSVPDTLPNNNNRNNNNNGGGGSGSVDQGMSFDDLSARFEKLKKK